MSTSPYTVVFFGTPDFSVPALRALVSDSKFRVTCVVTQPDRPAGRGGKVSPSPVKAYAISQSIPVLQPESVRKDANFLESMSAFGPFDVGVVAAFGQILPTVLLDTPRAGCVNIHGSLLPRWRGAAPIHRALLAGDSKTGIALMRMEAGLDTGAVFSTREIAITGSDTIGTLHDALAHAGADLLVRDLTKIISGELHSVPQPSEGITIAPKVTNAEAAIDWSRSAAEIDRQVRAFSPSPGAFTFLNGVRLKIFRGSPKPALSNATKMAGQVVLIDSERLEIATSDGAYAIEEAQLEGKKRLSIGELLRGNPLSTATLLGS